jgi:transcriptional regulator with XRE-family HTH domain
MATSERRRVRGCRQASIQVRAIGADIRAARTGVGLSLESAGRSVGLSATTYRRIEAGDTSGIPVRQLSLAATAVGLELVLRTFPDDDPVRDAGHEALLGRIRACLPSDAPWQREVPLSQSGDRRAWDARTLLERQRVDFEAEMRIGDIQALQRKLELKRRDGDGRIVILVVADTRHNRRVLALHRESLRTAFPLDTRAVLKALRAGKAPAASGIVVI